MALKYGDRVQETFTTTGTGTVSLLGPVTGYQAFSAILSNADTCYYAMTDGTNWEVGLGTYTTSGTTLARTTVYESSNSNAAVNWGAGTKTVWLDLPATAIATFVGSVANSWFLTGSQTWTSPSDVTAATVFEVYLQGPGGGGGGASSTTGASGAGAGGEAILLNKNSVLASTGYVYTEGAVGTGGATGANNGTDAGNSTFVIAGTTLTANGGKKGLTGTSSNGGLGGTATGGTINLTGQSGSAAVGQNVNIAPGVGGNCRWGFGGQTLYAATAQAGQNYGGGGGGGFGNSAQAGNSGAPGMLLIKRVSG